MNPLSLPVTGYEMVSPRAPLRGAVRAPRPLADSEMMIKVAGCGVCHTDLGFLDDGVRTRRPPPLILGHEISGHVEAAGRDFAGWEGRAVVVPAVLPCGTCARCRAGRSALCKSQVMPGNDCDGGFADRVILPGRGICPVPGATADPDAPLGKAPGLTLRHLAVVADAVSTAYQSVLRSELKPGSIAVVVGLGGVGGYAAQIAALLGAHVAGLDVDPLRREAAAKRGAALTLDPAAQEPKALRKTLLEFAASKGADESGWTILECSGNPAGQRTAFGLLGPGATLMVVGYTLTPIDVRLSNLMAFDARMIGNWGCAPEHYPAILERVLDGRIEVAALTELQPLADIAGALAQVREHRTERRIVLVPEDKRRLA